MSLEATAFGCAKWSIRSKRFAVLGCLKNELAGRSVEKLMDDLRGRWNCPGDTERKARSERSGGRHIGLLAIFKGEPRGELWLDCLQSAAETATLLVSSVVLAEVRFFFPSDNACRNALRRDRP